VERLFKVSTDHIWVGAEDEQMFFGITNPDPTKVEYRQQ
jgi:hypothetical protein